MEASCGSFPQSFLGLIQRGGLDMGFNPEFGRNCGIWDRTDDCEYFGRKGHTSYRIYNIRQYMSYKVQRCWFRLDVADLASPTPIQEGRLNEPEIGQTR